MNEQTKPVLLTEADVTRMAPMNFREKVAFLRERGLIAPEPVDPLLVEAREICACMPGVDALQAGEYRSGRWDAGGVVDLALAALKRGMELARPTLTREQVAKAVFANYTNGGRWMGGGDIDRLHAALTGGAA